MVAPPRPEPWHEVAWIARRTYGFVDDDKRR
jgi:hypothetical protein